MIHLRAGGFPCNRGGNGQALLETQQGAVQVRSWEIREELVAHPEEVTQSPDGKWALNEYITKQKSAVN